MAKDQRIQVRSAGLSSKSRRQLSGKDVAWADLILVMEQAYKSHILGKFRHLDLPKIVSLDIPDEYEYMMPELIELIEKSVEYHIRILAKK